MPINIFIIYWHFFMRRDKNTYKGSKLLKPTNVNIEYTEEQILEIIKCKEDPVYFIENYMKIVSLDKGIIPFKMYDFQKKMIETFHNNRHSVAKLSRQSGKALSVNTFIPTPSGWTTMEELKVGDYIFSPSGMPVKVLFKTDTMYNHECFNISFDTGETITVDAEHLWIINSSSWKHKEYKTLTSREIYEKYSKKRKNKRGKGYQNPFYIDITKPLELPKLDLPIDPYVLGVWLGDGHSHAPWITCNKFDFESFYKDYFNIETITEVNDNCIRFKISNLKEKLEKNNLIRNKHIPQEYLRASFEQRLELLRGLIDTDGWVCKNKRSVEFYQKSEKFVKQVRELICSLGIKARPIRKREINGEFYHCICFTPDFVPANLPRKVKNFTDQNQPIRNTDKRIYIQDIVPVESVPVQCIKVDSEEHLFLCGETFVPTHNTTSTVGYVLHQIIFNDNFTIGILANKLSMSKEIISRLQLAYEKLPKWLQHGIISWNKGSIELENGSSVIAASTSSSAVRGLSLNTIILDEFAFVPEHIADEFFTSTYPTISAGKETKIIITSTPKGYNMFYKIWTDAINKKNEFVPFEINWYDVPGRDEKFKETTIKNIGLERFNQEYICSFLGSSDTLIEGDKLATISTINPLEENDGLAIFEKVENGNKYMITVDVSRGTNNDYSAFLIFDISGIPYKVVGRYKNNKIKPIMFPSVIKRLAEEYNDAFVLIEINDIGQQVAEILYLDLEYENVLMCGMRGRAGQILGAFFSGKAQYGLKMSSSTKKVGCSNLKTIIESDRLIFQDYEILEELTRYVRHNNTFKAEAGYHDDLCSCLVIFGWAATQPYFKEIASSDVREHLYKEKEKIINNQLLPFGFKENGVVLINEVEENFVDGGDLWMTVKEPSFISYGMSYLV